MTHDPQFDTELNLSISQFKKHFADMYRQYWKSKVLIHDLTIKQAYRIFRQMAQSYSHKLRFDLSCPISTATSNIVSSHSWKVDLSGKDGYVAGGPRMKSFVSDTFSLEDPDMEEHRDFLNYWEDDY